MIFRLVEGILAFLLIVAGVCLLFGIPWALLTAGVLLTADSLTDR